MTFEQAWEAWWPTYLQAGWTLGDKIKFEAGWKASQATLSAPRPDEGVVEALRRATIRSYSHKQLDLSLEFQNSDDLTAVVTSVGANPEKRP